MNKKELKQIFENFNDKKAIIVGDIMLDAYWWGNVSRISPEAPVPIVAVKEKEHRLGGSANVALNIKKMGAEPLLVSIIGNDHEGETFKQLLDKNGISSNHLIISDTRCTTVKTRVIGNKHQLLRVDNEEDGILEKNAQKLIFQRVSALIDNADILIFEDYDKGVLSKELIKKLMDIANERKIPTVVDPKKRNFMAYKNATMFKPNLKELQDGLKMELKQPFSISGLKELVDQLLQKINVEIAFVTLSEKGVFIGTKNQHFHIPAHIRSVYDVSGAGDTVIAVASLALASGLPLKTIAEIANLAGGLVCEKVGVVPIDKQLLFQECERTLVSK